MSVASISTGTYAHSLSLPLRRSQRKLADLWKYGLPPIVRGKVWKLVIGNLLGVNQGIYSAGSAMFV